MRAARSACYLAGAACSGGFSSVMSAQVSLPSLMRMRTGRYCSVGAIQISAARSPPLTSRRG